MANARVGILGYGVIGRRLADAVALQPDMRLVGIAGKPSSFSLRDAQLHGYEIYLTEPVGKGDVAARIGAIHGDLPKLLSQVDVLLDCTPSGVPPQYRELLNSHKQLVTIVQGGERHAENDVSFNSMTNFRQAEGKKRIRIISCSSTATTRFLYALHRTICVQHAFVTLARRAADPGKPGKIPFNSLVPCMGQSHHSYDVNTVFPVVRLVSVSVDCPTTLSHVLRFQVDMQRAVSREEILNALSTTPRVVVGRGLRSTAALAEYYNDGGRRRSDRPEIYVFEESIEVRDKTLLAAISVHMESITIPETIDCVRASFHRTRDPWESIALTDRTLGIFRPEARYAAND